MIKINNNNNNDEKERKLQNTRGAVRIKQRKICVSAGNGTQDHSVCATTLWPLSYRDQALTMSFNFAFPLTADSVTTAWLSRKRELYSD